MGQSPKGSQAAPGELIWRFSADSSINSSPVATETSVYVTERDDNLISIEPDSGNWQWYFEIDTGVFAKSSPTLADGVLYLGSGDNALHAINASEATTKWKFDTGGKVCCQPTVSEGSVYFVSDDGNIYALNVDTGVEEWKFRLDMGDHIKLRSSPAVYDNTVYVGSQNSNVYALDADTGGQQWKFETRSFIQSSPAVSEETVFVGSVDNNLYAIDVKTGKKRWHFKTQDAISEQSSAVVDKESVYIGSEDGSVYAIDKDSGGLNWKYETKGMIMTTPKLANDIVYFGSKDERFYAVNIHTGGKEWTFEAEAPVSACSNVYQDVVYVGSQDNNLYALKAGPNQQKTSHSTQSHDPDQREKKSALNISEEVTLDKLSGTSRKEMKKLLHKMDPYEFEKLVGKIWEGQGYQTTVRQSSSDRGIDIEATKQAPFSQTVLIQAKRYSDDNKVGSGEVRRYATLYQQRPEADTVIIVTTSQFTSEAQALADDLGVKTVDFNSLYYTLSTIE